MNSQEYKSLVVNLTANDNHSRTLKHCRSMAQLQDFLIVCEQSGTQDSADECYAGSKKGAVF